MNRYQYHGKVASGMFLKKIRARKPKDTATVETYFKFLGSTTAFGGVRALRVIIYSVGQDWHELEGIAKDVVCRHFDDIVTGRLIRFHQNHDEVIAG